MTHRAEAETGGNPSSNWIHLPSTRGKKSFKMKPLMWLKIRKKTLILSCASETFEENIESWPRFCILLTRGSLDLIHHRSHQHFFEQNLIQGVLKLIENNWQRASQKKECFTTRMHLQNGHAIKNNSVNTPSLNRHAEISTSDDVFPLSWLRKRQHWAPLNISLHSILPTYLFLRHLYLVNHIKLFNNKAFERLPGVKAYLAVLHLKQIILNPFIPKKDNPTRWGSQPLHRIWFTPPRN